MTATPFISYRLSVEPLTPIHVGSGVTIEPQQYALEPEKTGAGGWLHLLDADACLASLDETARTHFLALITRAEFPQVRTWLRTRANQPQFRRASIGMAPSAYAEVSGGQNNPERLGEIHLFAREAGTGRPFVPGSSIKGAVRTALVDAAAHDGLTPARSATLTAAARQSGSSFEAHVLGHTRPDGRPDLYRDPLRQLAVSDLLLPPNSTYISQVKLVRRRHWQPRAGQADAAGVLLYREVTRSLANGRPVNVEGEMRLRPGLGDRRLMGTDALPRSWSLQGICDACNRFYVPLIASEVERFPVAESAADVLRRASEGLSALQCLIRLGRHSHFEAMTVTEPFRVPPPKGFGATRTYAGGSIPLGWARLTFVPVG